MFFFFFFFFKEDISNFNMARVKLKYLSLAGRNFVFVFCDKVTLILSSNLHRLARSLEFRTGLVGRLFLPDSE